MTQSLDSLISDGVIEGVVGQLQSGKEAEVWLVQHAGRLVAAKLYKERHERNFKNNAGYREGREVRNSRTRRAMAKGSKFGQAAAEEAWKSAEADSLYKLHAQGVRVPEPVLFYEGILLMELVLGEDGQPAPRMVEAPPRSPDEALAQYLDIRSQVVRMLCADLIHGDLSPYNILIAPAGPTIIDFPQTLAAARNNLAENYFQRDVENVRTFLAAYDPRVNAMAGDAREIWNAYTKRELTPDFVPSTRGGGATQKRGVEARPVRVAEPRPVPVPVVALKPARAMTPEEAEEAELRELEKLVLRQGGGERGRPPPAAKPADFRRRGPGRGPGSSAGRGPGPAGNRANGAVKNVVAKTPTAARGGAPQQAGHGRSDAGAARDGSRNGGHAQRGAPASQAQAAGPKGGQGRAAAQGQNGGSRDLNGGARNGQAREPAGQRNGGARDGQVRNGGPREARKGSEPRHPQSPEAAPRNVLSNGGGGQESQQRQGGRRSGGGPGDSQQAEGNARKGGAPQRNELRTAQPPKQPEQDPRRGGAARSQRSGPQVSYVSRPNTPGPAAAPRRDGMSSRDGASSGDATLKKA